MASLSIQPKDAAPYTRELPPGTASIGRHPASTIILEDGTISSHHAEIVEAHGAYTVRDLQSTNGVKVNGTRTRESMIKDGDTVSFGAVKCLFHAPLAATVAPAAPPLPVARVATPVAVATAAPVARASIPARTAVPSPRVPPGAPPLPQSKPPLPVVTAGPSAIPVVPTQPPPAPAPEEPSNPANSRRPLALTILCVPGFIGLAVLAGAVVLDLQHPLPVPVSRPWYLTFLISNVSLAILCLIGVWRLRRWAVFSYVLLFLANQGTELFWRTWTPAHCLFAGLFVATGFYYLPRCTAIGETTLPPRSQPPRWGRRFLFVFGIYAIFAVVVIGARILPVYLDHRTIRLQPSITVNDEDYFPVRDGADAVFDVDLVESYRHSATTEHRLIGEAVDLDGQHYRRQRRLFGGAADATLYLLRVDSHAFYDLQEGRSPEQQRVPFPLTVGKVWKTQKDQIPATVFVVGWQDITIGTKTYRDCLRTHEMSDDAVYQKDTWYAPGIGPVKWRVVGPSWKRQVASLRDFKPGPTTAAAAPVPPEAAASKDEYFPLAVGQQATFMTTRSVSSPEASKTPAPSEIIFHEAIVGVVEKNGQTYYRLRRWYPQTTWTETTYLLRKDDHAIYITSDGLYAEEQVEYDLPLEAGATGHRSFGKLTENYLALARESTEAGGKTYADCFHIQSGFSDGSSTSDIWIAPKVGIVKSITKYSRGDVFTEILKDFQPAAEPSPKPATKE